MTHLKTKLYAIEKNIKSLSSILSLLIKKSGDDKIILESKELEHFYNSFVMTTAKDGNIEITSYKDVKEYEKQNINNFEDGDYSDNEEPELLNELIRKENIRKLVNLVVIRVSEEVIRSVA